MADVSGTLDDAYFEWLYSQVASVTNRNPERSYWELCKQLYSTPFLWFVANDGNRVEDGKELRFEFLEQTSMRVPSKRQEDAWLDLDCSMFEMLIALSQRAAFESDRSLVEWFWRFMQNLEIDRYSDDLYEISIQEEVEEALDRVVNRTYSQDGVGGLFPLRNASQDQRKVELWYQMSAYLLEGSYVNSVPWV